MDTEEKHHNQKFSQLSLHTVCLETLYWAATQYSVTQTQDQKRTP
jgi:hypothetical protein